MEEPHYVYLTRDQAHKHGGDSGSIKRARMDDESPYSRMVLIVEDKYEELKKVATAAAAKVPSLYRTDIPPDQVVKLYSHELEKKRHKLSTLAAYREVSTSPPSPPPVPVINSTQEYTEKLKMAISSFPKYCRAKARGLLDLMIAHNVHWDERGQIPDENNQTIEGSHILDLIRFAVDNRAKLRPPTGWIQMKKILRAANIPKQYIGNIGDGEAASGVSAEARSNKSAEQAHHLSKTDRIPSYIPNEAPASLTRDIGGFELAGWPVE